VRHGWLVRALVRTIEAGHEGSPPNLEYVAVGDIAKVSDWSNYCEDCHVVVHLAARAHKVYEAPTQATEDFLKVNRDASTLLARDAAKSGVKRFIFISSAGVMGESSVTAFTELDIPKPISEYAKSKLKAELALSSLCDRTKMELVILRPTLIYGPGNPGNLDRLVRLIRMGIPLPFARIDNKRSLLNVSYFAKIIRQAAIHPRAAGYAFLVSDGQDISTTQLVKSLARSADIEIALFPFPQRLLRLGAAIARKRRDVEKILSTFQVDSSLVRARLGLSSVSTRELIELHPVDEDIILKS
jgi:nucleoside-diphosphate-sugar epimerase